MNYKKFIVFKKDNRGSLTFIQMVDEEIMHEQYNWKDILNDLVYKMRSDKKDIVVFEFDDSNPSLELNYVESIEPKINSKHFHQIIDKTKYKKNNASDVITDN